MADQSIQNTAPSNKVDDRLTPLLLHYSRGVQDSNTRRTRKNGWNEVTNAYMGKLPLNWPYQSVVVDPRIRTAVLEKTARLLNAKLQGRLVPREGGDIIKARINNAILDFQWDNANVGGSMIEKIAQADQICRLFGAAWVWVYWNNETNCNEIKVWDPRDIWWDGGATHVKNAKWVQMREWTSLETLKARGYDTKKIEKMIKNGEVYNNNQRNTAYESIEKVNRFVEDQLGQDPFTSVVEIVTEWHKDTYTVFAPKYALILKTGTNPYKHGQIPVTQLRYYPLGDEIWGESEVESVLPLWRAINATLCGYVDEMNIAMRPPIRIASAGVRMETIEYGPGAKWIMNDINNVAELPMGGQAIAHFHETYPALVAAFNTAMGQESLGLSNTAGSGFSEKTATEVRQITSQSNNRDQYNQLYLGEFLKDIMMMWLSNNQQYIFDDPSKAYYVLKIIGKDQIQQFQQLGLDSTNIDNAALLEAGKAISENPEAVNNKHLQDLTDGIAIPENPVVTNPNETDPAKYEVKPKLLVKNTNEADLHVTPDDFDGVYDYIPDVRSMATGAGVMQQQARDKALEFATNPVVQQQLQTAGYMLKMKDILENTFEDAGYRDAESFFQPINTGLGQPNGNPNGQPGAVGPAAPQASIGANGLPPVGGVPGLPQAVPSPSQFPGLPTA